MTRTSSSLIAIVCGWAVCGTSFADPESVAGRIFRCETNGKVTYSDTACAQSPDKTEVIAGPLNTADAQPVAQSNDSQSIYVSPPNEADRRSAGGTRSGRQRSERSVSIAASQARQKERCKTMAANIEAIRKQQWETRHVSFGGVIKSSSNNKERDEKVSQMERERKDAGCR